MLSHELKKIEDDSNWWQTMLPKGWNLYGFTYKHSASAIHKETGSYVELNPRFLCDLHGRDYDKEVKCH